MKVSAIAVVTKNRVLGKDDSLLFHVPGDLPRFQKITSGHPVIMGRKTFESKEIGKKALPGRVNIVVTRDPNYKAEGVVVAKSVEGAIKVAKSCHSERSRGISHVCVNSHSREIPPLPSVGRDDNKGEIFIIGGGQIYKEAWPFIDKLYLTVVDIDAEGDTYFPDYSDFKKIIFREKHEEKGMKYTFLELEK
ncbi:dihydrofolate reductase [Patescibacteria group bacterium]|nr:dihydrofolate reductase [Patescibacteria group bacterium]MBU4098146.1 dihydrofolate reductase [Patescibacteria group bacterium]